MVIAAAMRGCMVIGLMLAGGCQAAEEALEQQRGAAEAEKVVARTTRSCGDYAGWIVTLECDQWATREATDPKAAAYQRGIRSAIPDVLAKSRWASECAPYQKDIDALARAVSRAVVVKRSAIRQQGGDDDISHQCDAIISKAAAAYPDLARLIK